MTPGGYQTYAEFLDADDRRHHGKAYECRHDWHDEHGHRHRVCWYAETGELTLEQLSEHQPLDLEDFAAGVTGPIEILTHFDTRTDFERTMGPWPELPRLPARSVDALRAHLAKHPHLRLVPSTD
jgi:hypothetical protein